MYNYTLKYRTFDQLLNDVYTDFASYKLSDLIEPQELIRVVKRVNYDLGLRIQQTKEEVLEVEHGRVKLPDNFNILNYALICDSYNVYQQTPQGTHLEDIPVYNTFPTTLNSCNQPIVNCDTTVEGCTSACTCGTCPTCTSLVNTCTDPIITTTTTTTTSEVETFDCMYVIPNGEIDRAGAVTGTIIINGVLYTYTFGTYVGFVDYLNSLNLGIFEITSNTGKLITVHVIGVHDYGDMVIISSTPVSYPIHKECVVIRTDTVSTTTTNNTSTQQCCPTSPDPCSKPRVMMNCRGECYEVIQRVNDATVFTYNILIPLKILEAPQSVDCNCPNIYIDNGLSGWIKDGYLYTNFTSGKVYINYQGMMEDDKGNLLAPDHDGINDYYEYALKQRILENLFFANKPVQAQLQYAEMKLRTARKEAVTLVNTPNFNELKRIWEMNRKAQYAKYVDMFKSYRTINGTYVENYLMRR
jgi:hypothetical protein